MRRSDPDRLSFIRSDPVFAGSPGFAGSIVARVSVRSWGDGSIGLPDLNDKRGEQFTAQDGVRDDIAGEYRPTRERPHGDHERHRRTGVHALFHEPGDQWGNELSPFLVAALASLATISRSQSWKHVQKPREVTEHGRHPRLRSGCSPMFCKVRTGKNRWCGTEAISLKS